MLSGVLHSDGFSGGEMGSNLYQMIRILRSQKKGLHVCHINAQSLAPKLDEFRLLFINSKVDVICISETWFSPEISNSAYKVEGYKLYRADRIGRERGGVAAYLRSDIYCEIECKSDIHSTSEYLFLKLHCDVERLLIGVVYRPNKNIDATPIIRITEEISCSASNVIICGDLNCDLLNTATSAKLVDSFRSLNLRPVNFSTPTHFTKETATLLDVFFVGNTGKAVFYNQLSASGFSKHDLIYLTYDIPIGSEQNEIIFRDFKNINYESLQIDIANVQWEQIHLMSSVEQQVVFLQQNIKTLFDQHVPLKTKIIKSNSPPWLTNQTLELIQKRDRAYIRWKRYKLQELYETYRSFRNLVVLRIQSAKRAHYETFLCPSNQSGRDIWKKLRKLGNGKQQLEVAADVDCDMLNSQFVSAAVSTNYSNTESQLPWQQIEEVVDGEQHFEFNTLSDEDIVEAILSVKSNATGLDDINPKFLKLLLPCILKYLTYIFNNILTTCEYPLLWKKAKILPIPKANRVKTEYRPISILPFLSKVFEKAILKQLQRYLFANNLLSSAQSGFRAKRSCKTALLLVVDDIRKAMDKSCCTFLTLLDFSKAFDTVNHFVLCKKLLSKFRLSPSAVKLLYSYLTGRQQCVAVGNRLSSLLRITAGVPQGSVLSPLLFSMYVNELPELVKHCSVHMFADDVQLYLNCPLTNISSAIDKVNVDLEIIQQWALKHSLSLNPGKSKTLCIYKQQLDTSNFPPVKLGESVIEYVRTAKNLGLVFNENLSWNDHIATTVGKVYNGLRLLWCSQRSIPTATKMLLAKSLLLPVLTYCCEVFCNVDYNTKRKLNIIYNNLARYVFNKRRFDHISAYSKQITGLRFEDLITYRSLILLHGIIQSHQPDYLYNRLNFPNSQRTTVLIQPRFNCLQSERTFFVHVTRQWNSLPIQLRRITNAHTFKTDLFKYLARNT